MFSSLLSVLLASSALASPVKVNSFVTLPISKRVNLTGTRTLLERDLARVTHLRDKAHARLSGQPLASRAVISDQVFNEATTYLAAVDVGTPPTTFALIIDTGSSNTWVGATTPFVNTATTVSTGQSVAVSYGSGDFQVRHYPPNLPELNKPQGYGAPCGITFSLADHRALLPGTEVLDTVTLAPGLTITNQSIGVASSSDGFEGVDGILGIGPVDLTLDTLSPDTNSAIPTVTDNLFTQGTITQNLIGISFEPTNVDEIQNGELTFGGTDSTKFTGEIHFAPVTTVAPASEFWGITQSVRYGASTTIFNNLAGIVDTGTTLLLLPTSGFNTYTRATGAVEDATTGLLRVTNAQFNKLQSLFFTINGQTFEFTANAQLWPRALNTAIGGRANNIYLIVSSLGASTETGFDFVNGFVWLERFYSVFDTTNKQIGFATTPFTNSTIN
ncbi:acid protease [Roridomyces roridus]|uniref:Acid protease n=1 Tax=Roridomyces roridus TaxID=1738132 RepID=A0AAD7BIE3_9AGAR|nr:acid protease [Roridomyces roridus]